MTSGPDDRFGRLYDAQVDSGEVLHSITNGEWCPINHALEENTLYVSPLDELVKHEYGSRVFNTITYVGAEFFCRHEQPEPLRTLDPVGFLRLHEVNKRLRRLENIVRAAFIQTFLEDCCKHAAHSLCGGSSRKDRLSVRSYSSAALRDLADDLAEQMYREYRNGNGSR